MTDSTHPLLELLPGMARLCVTNGVKLPELVEALKANMVEQAIALQQESLQEHAIKRKIPESTLSMMTGVHRKDVKRLRDQKHQPNPQRASLASQVFSRWMSETPYASKPGKAKLLHRTGSEGPSFESLVASISSDVHHRSVLDELLRLGFVAIDAQDRVRLTTKNFTPPKGERESIAISAQNIADHMLACANNLHGQADVCLEQALFSDQLSEESAQRFSQLTAQAWDACFDAVMPELQALFKEDKRKPDTQRTHRVRLGMYGYMSKT